MVGLLSGSKVEQLLNHPGIIRHRLKIHSAIENARAFIKIKEKYGRFSDYLWRFVDGRPIINHWRHATQIPSTTVISNQMSKALRQSGFSFVGPTICYAYMQAIGMVNDHLINCFRHQEVMPFSGSKTARP